ncbi:MAG: non-ribosomal peptide synthetase, partial [Actinobacteria bacterium]|nr:non-ribosomal peptide synthetase [Actinomycetota bacterium]
MNTENIQDIYPLSPMQQGMLFHSLYSPESGAYIEQTFADLVGELNVDAFEKAWQTVIERNPILRTAFVWEGVDEPVQVVFVQLDFTILKEDWRQKAKNKQDKHLDDYLQKERARGFDLTAAPLMRIALFQTANDVFKLVWTHHHLLLDGWSNQLLLQELFTLYNAFENNESLDLPERPPFRLYIDWLQKQDAAKAEAFWCDELAGFSAPTPLVPGKTTAAPERTNRYDLKKKLLSAEESKALREFSKNSGITLNTLVQGAWSLLLSRYSREDDVIFGATVSGRPTDLPGVDVILGLFINTLPVRAYVDSHKKVLDWLKELQARQVGSRDFEYSSLVQIKSWCNIPGDVSLFNSILVFESFPMA